MSIFCKMNGVFEVAACLAIYFGGYALLSAIR